MTSLVHLSDLHFGMHRQELLGPLTDAILAQDPDMILVSGDLSHNGRTRELREAADFITSLRRPWLAVPGNHDMPRLNPAMKLAAPFRRFRAIVPEAQRHFARIGRLRLFGLNSAHPCRARSGVFREAELLRVEAGLREGPGTGEADVLNFLVLHHPLSPSDAAQQSAALERLRASGLHGLFCGGHRHRRAIGEAVQRDAPGGLLELQASTALYNRPGEKNHGFTVIRDEGSGLRVTPHTVIEATRYFEPRETRVFTRAAGLWHSG